MRMKIIVDPEVIRLFAVIWVLQRTMMALERFANIFDIIPLAYFRYVLPLIHPIVGDETAKFWDLAVICSLVGTAAHTFI